MGFDEDGNAVFSGNSVSFEGAHISADSYIRIEAKEYVERIMQSWKLLTVIFTSGLKRKFS